MSFYDSGNIKITKRGFGYYLVDNSIIYFLLIFQGKKWVFQSCEIFTQRLFIPKFVNSKKVIKITRIIFIAFIHVQKLGRFRP